jgi:alkanesulfonate monooxygenase SsuD/methylene tetrahydromethanopterin reductase-like flavin-dependent oxidoreductase (luciferase family)
MRFAIYVPNYGAYGDPAVLVELAVAAEAAGWDGFFIWDHIVVGTPPAADPWVTLGAMAARTTRIALGPLIVPLPRRRPWKLAMEAGTVQRLSGGRLVLGVGAGVPRDYVSFGEPSGAKARSGRLEEGVRVVRQLLSGEPVNHQGEHFQVNDVRMTPVDVPIWVSGIWPRKVPFVAADGAEGLFPIIRDDEGGFALPTAEQVAAIRAEFVAAGGKPDGELAIWGGGVLPEADVVASYEDAGATWLFSDGWKMSVDELKSHIAAGPPR